MPVRRLDEAGVEALRAPLVDPVVLARYRAKVTTVPGSECLWWTGAVSGRSDREATTGGGHGRFWFAPGRVIVAHRFAFAAIHGLDALAQARLLGHRCHNPLCQRIASTHVVVSTARQNRAEWAVQRRLPYSPLADPRGTGADTTARAAANQPLEQSPAESTPRRPRSKIVWLR